MSRVITEDILKRFHTEIIPCVWCGFPINKKNQLPHINQADNGDMIRKWRCLNCGHGFYQENISELQRLGIL